MSGDDTRPAPSDPVQPLTMATLPQDGVRRRAVGTGTRQPEYIPSHHGEERGRRPVPLPTPPLHFIGVLVALGFVTCLVCLVPSQLPEPLMLTDEHANPGHFIAERAWNTLKNLTSMGQRISGSYESEVLAVGILREEIAAIAAAAHSIHKVEVDFQRVSGAYPLQFLDGISHAYADLSNLVVRLSSAGKRSGYSILMNCHFDSVPDSPGATDDASSCVIMLEILRILSQSDTPLYHNLVLLFNGAEENFMQASHGFITKHKWAKEIRAVLNLESCGSGGKEMLFQTGPNHPWLTELYSKHAKHPFGSAIAQELFQSGLFPGDTDFRIFRDFGGIPGLDMAWYLNGYVYHTEHDNIANVPLGTLQRTGDNMLALTKALLSAEEIIDIEKHRDGTMIFFDFLGLFVLFWTLVAADILNVSVIIVSIYSLLSNAREANDRGLSRGTYFWQLCRSTGITLLSWAIASVVCVCIALGLTAMNLTMSWFAHPLWIVFLYAFPVLISSMCVLLWKSKPQRQIIISPWTLFQLYYDSSQIIWTLVLLLATVFRIQSGFIPLIFVLFPSVGNILRLKLFRHCRDWKWLPLHGAVLIIPFIQATYLIINGLHFLIPITGRFGAVLNSEIVLSVLCSVMFNFLFTYIVPIILLVRQPQKVVALSVGIFSMALALLICTPLGFPYSADPAALVPQRFALLHVRRSFHNLNGSVFKHETGFWIVHLDMNSHRLLRDSVPEVSRARSTVDDCDDHLYCGMPYYIPVRSFLWNNEWLDGPDVKIPINTSLSLVSKRFRSNTERRYTFNLTGPDHMEIMLSPVKEAQLLRWSFYDEIPLVGPQWNHRDTYYVYLAYADTPKVWTFSLDFQVPYGWTDAVFDIAVGSHFLHGPHKRSPELSHLIQQYPAWGTVTGWQAEHQSFVF